MSTVQNQGTKIDYEVIGEGPTVIAHHGGGMDRETWHRAGWIEPLASDFRVVTFDARGHGDSDKPTDPMDYSLDLMVDDVVAVADACDAEEFHFLGWSMGAKVGWGVAGQAQDRLGSIALIGADPEASDESAGEMIALLEQGIEAATDALSQMWEVPGWAADTYRDNDPDALLAYFRSSWPDLSDVPDGLEVPTLLMCGTEDEVHDAMVRAARRADIDLVELPGEDHMSSFLSGEAREAYRDFLVGVT